MDPESPVSPQVATSPPPATPPERPPSTKNEAMDLDLREEASQQDSESPTPAKKNPARDAAKRKAEEAMYKERGKGARKGYQTTEFQAKYKSTEDLKAAFNRQASLVDVYNIYRNRPGWIGRTEAEIVDIPRQVMKKIPSQKTAVLSYIGLLIHETTNSYFAAKENPQLKVDYTIVQTSAIKLLDDVHAMLAKSSSEPLYLDTLKWCCDLASEISEHNNGRPAMQAARSPEDLSALFKTCPTVEALIKLLDFAIEELLKYSSEQFMATLFYSSRHGSHFNWVWVHIAEKFPGKVVENMFTIGGQQFRTYVDAYNAKLRERAPLAELDQLHADYRTRFSSLAGVFNLLMRKGNLELRNTVTKMLTESLETDAADSSKANYNIVFFFKLVTISPDTLRYLLEQNLHLATPQNFFRGMRQILSMDKGIVLQRITYQEFGVQMLNVISPESQAVIFKSLARLALDPNILQGITGCGPNFAQNASVVKDGAFSAISELMNCMVVNTHSFDPVRPFDYTIISSFADGKELQFMIDTALSNPNCAPQILRYLHAVSMTFTPTKAAEIACRFVLSAKEPQYLHVLCAFLSTVVPFYPGLMETAYKNIFSIRELYLSEIDTEPSADRFQRNLAFIANVRNLLEWDVSIEDACVRNYDFNPRSQGGHLLAGLLSICLSVAHNELAAKNVPNVLLTITEVGKLLKAITQPYNQQKNVHQIRSFVVKVRYIYKISILLAHLLKIALCTVSKDSTAGLFHFEDFRNTIVLFYSEQVNQLHLSCGNRRTGMAQLFFVSFLANCLMDNKNLFGEDLDLDPFKDPSIEKLKLDDDDEDYSFLEALQSMDTHQKISRLAHSGVIGQGAKHLTPPFIASDDQLIRAHVFLDAVRNICVTESPLNNVINTRHLGLYLVELICCDAVASEMLFQDWDLEKETLGKYQVVQTFYRSWLLRGLMNIVAEVQPCLWICLPVMKAQLADILSSLLSTTSRTAKVSNHIMDLIDKWMVLARAGNLVPSRFELFLDFLPHVTVHEAYLLFLEAWRFFQRRSVTLNMVEHAIEIEKASRGSGVLLLQDTYEGDYQTCRRIIQRHISELGYLFPKLFASSMHQLPSTT